MCWNPQNPVRPYIVDKIHPIVESEVADDHDPEISRASQGAENHAEVPELSADLEEGEIPTAAEAQPSIGLRAPGTPSAKEKEDHDRTHLPFREWCDVCVRARGQAHHHATHKAEQDRYSVAQLVLDFWFIGGDGDTGQEKLPILVMYEKAREVLFGHRV